MQSELSEIHNSQESLRWLAGGIVSLGKAWLTGPVSGNTKKEHAPVKKPGILAALTAVAALALLLIPIEHKGLRALLWSWLPNRLEANQSQLLKMALDAESRGDAKAMAFAAMRMESRKDLVSFANKAVAMDPSLTWIYSQGYESDSWQPEAHDWATKLAAWDTDNGVAFLVQAEIRKSELVHAGIPSWDAVIHEPQWLESGRKAMESPRYDSYRAKRLELDRDVIRTQHLNDLEVFFVAAFPARWATLWPAQVYSMSVLSEAKAALARGDKQTAMRDAWAVAHFGELLRANGGNEGERLSSAGYLRPAYTILQPLLAAEGRTDEAKMLSHELDAIRPGAPATLSSFWFESNYGWLKAASVAMNLGAAVAVLLSIALMFAGTWLFAARFSPGMNSEALHRFACRSARFAPVGLLISFAAIAVSYLPASESISNYLWRPTSTATMQGLVEAFASVYYSQDLVKPSAASQYHPTFWLIATVLGTLTIMMIIGRNILNRRLRPNAA
jgi:hypothetical protein